MPILLPIASSRATFLYFSLAVLIKMNKCCTAILKIQDLDLNPLIMISSTKCNWYQANQPKAMRTWNYGLWVETLISVLNDKLSV